ncbi:hypothetical protein [Lachnoclostridium phytofermentans]|uniref:hypothetical protein n=1 Tax=Lachnoclostridium phytofermentans TaxID=66219 RepID=UPI000A876C5E|nr:hypothetical protein [Lachnoclostridium phytofermentans]
MHERLAITGTYDTTTSAEYKAFAIKNGIPYTLNGYVASIQGINLLAVFKYIFRYSRSHGLK